MRFVEFLVVLSYRLFSVVRLTESLVTNHGMGVPLSWHRGEGWDSKAISVDYVVGAATKEPLEGRPILEKRRLAREFNATKDYPGEDGPSSCNIANC